MILTPGDDVDLTMHLIEIKLVLYKLLQLEKHLLSGIQTPDSLLLQSSMMLRRDWDLDSEP